MVIASHSAQILSLSTSKTAVTFKTSVLVYSKDAPTSLQSTSLSHPTLFARVVLCTAVITAVCMYILLHQHVATSIFLRVLFLSKTVHSSVAHIFNQFFFQRKVLSKLDRVHSKDASIFVTSQFHPALSLLVRMHSLTVTISTAVHSFRTKKTRHSSDFLSRVVLTFHNLYTAPTFHAKLTFTLIFILSSPKLLL